MGKKSAMTFPSARLEAAAIHTARQTRKLHRTPRRKASPAPSAALLSAMETIERAKPSPKSEAVWL